MNIDPKHEYCKGRKRTLDKNIIKFMYPSLSQEVFDTLSPKLQVCTDMYMDCNTKQKEHNALSQDENYHNIIQATNAIANNDINDTEVMHQKNIINDDIIANSTEITSDSIQELLKTEVFETKSISTQSIEQVFSKNGWRKSYTDIQERSRIKRMNQICTLILAAAVSVHDFNGKDKNISLHKDIAIACVVIMNDVQFKLEKYFGINLEYLDVDDHSNTILESNEHDTKF